MSRNTCFVLLLATGVALSGDRPQAGQAAASPAAAARPAQGRADAAQTKSAGAQGQVEPATTDKAGATTDATQVDAEEAATLKSTPGAKGLGMSILGNQEAPTSLVIVPWKSSELGASLGISPMLDDSRQPVDKDVFMRALRYYEIRSEAK